MDILHSKFANAIANARKNKIWEEITEAVNAVDETARRTLTGTPRTTSINQ